MVRKGIIMAIRYSKLWKRLIDDIKICLVKNGYPPQYSPEVFNKVMEQVENFEEYSDVSVSIKENAASYSNIYKYISENSMLRVAEESIPYGDKK